MIDKAREQLGYDPKVLVDEGVYRSLVWYHHNPVRGRGVMKVSIVGTGYVGLVTGACLAERGHDVVCVDVDRSKVDAINARRAPIHEAGLPELLQRHVGTRLRATSDLAAAVAASELTFIAVGTPAAEGRIDLRTSRRRPRADRRGAARRRPATTPWS